MQKKLLAASLLLFLGAGCSGTATVDTTSDTAAGGTMPAGEEGSGTTSDTEGMVIEGTEGEEADSDMIAEVDVEANADVDVTVNTVAFTVTGNNFAFAPSTMTVKKGDTVQITFVNSDGFHDLVIDEFEGAKTARLQTSASETITFVADQAGTFEYYCSVGEHRAMGMKGTLTVTE